MVHEMNAPVQHHAAAVLGKGAPAIELGVVAENLALDGVYFPQRSRLDDLAQHLIIAVPPAVLVHGEKQAGLAGHRDDFVQIGHR
jgi:hypothetical protein